MMRRQSLETNDKENNIFPDFDKGMNSLKGLEDGKCNT